MCKKTLFVCVVLFVIPFVVTAQKPGPYHHLDPKPYDPKVDVNTEMFISHWELSMPRHSHGSLVERDIFTQCGDDPLKPTKKGGVLTEIKRFSHASLDTGASTAPTTLKDEQEIFYIDSGKGRIKAGKKTADLYGGVGVLMPPGIEFTMTNTGDEPLTMYVIVEPIPDGFNSNKEMLVRDENIIPIGGTTGHWSHISTRLFVKEDGLAVITGMAPVWYDPMTMGQPHSHGEGVEEIWFALRGDITLLLGKRITKLLPGSGYKIPSNGKTPHSNINLTDEPIKLFWFMKSVPGGKVVPYANLDPKPYDPKTEVDMDMFISSWKESMPKKELGSIIVRDIFTRAEDDPLRPYTRGAVLNYLTGYTHGTLYPHLSTTPSALKGEQKVFYICSGKGTVSAGGKTADLHEGVGVLMPANLEFVIKNTCDEPLNMYIITEPIPDGFQPRKDMLVKDEKTIPISGTTGHWANITKRMFGRDDGLAMILGMSPVWLAPMTMAQPHASDPVGVDVLWVALKGDITTLLGKELRKMPPGSAFKNPGDGRVYHANINVTNEPIKLFWTRTIAPE
ncbi:cupin domain-containing protein [Candidatus Latescibacterota bacterium]